jgi:DMSO reductase anchor subunit
MVYVDTGREFWRLGRTGARFLGSVLVLGAAIAWACGAVGNGPAIVILVALTGARLAGAASMLMPGKKASRDALTKSALLHWSHFRNLTLAWLALWIVGGAVVPALAFLGAPAFLCAPIAMLALLAGDLIERSLFFSAIAPSKMPGGFAAY